MIANIAPSVIATKECNKPRVGFGALVRQLHVDFEEYSELWCSSLENRIRHFIAIGGVSINNVGKFSETEYSLRNAAELWCGLALEGVLVPPYQARRIAHAVAAAPELYMATTQVCAVVVEQDGDIDFLVSLEEIGQMLGPNRALTLLSTRKLREFLRRLLPLESRLIEFP